MIISEVQVKTPIVKYTLSVHCKKTRRLTAMEWLILSCISKFNDSEVMSKRTLKNAFEHVLNLQDSNYLIAPSIKELTRLGVIETKTDFTYNTRFGSMSLTDKGKQMLHDGILPGESTENKCILWYNPLTEQVNSQEMRKKTADSAITFSLKNSSNNIFPENLIKNKLQTGEVATDKFIASEYLIDNIEQISSEVSETILTLLLDLNESGELTVTPDIQEDKLKNSISDLYLTNFLKAYGLKNCVNKNELQVREVLGAGQRIEDALKDVCLNSKFLFIDKQVFSALSQQPQYESWFANKYLVVFNSESFSIKSLNSAFIINVPFHFEISGCAIMNDKNQSVSLCKTTASYKGKVIELPLAVKDLRITNNFVLSWFVNELRKSAKRDISYMGVFTLPILRTSENIYTDLNKFWNSKDFNNIIEDIRRMTSVSKRLECPPFDFSPLYEVITEKIDSKTPEVFISNIQKLMDSGAIEKGSDFHKMIVKKALSMLRNKPQTYQELKKLQNQLRIDSHDVALNFDEQIDPLYSTSIVKDVLNQIMDGKYKKINELFSADAFFNTYYDNISQIETLLGINNLFVDQDIRSFKANVLNCPSIAMLQSSILELKVKNADLVENNNINIYSLFNDIDTAKATSLYNNLNLVDEFLLEKATGIISSDRKTSPTEPKHINEKVYVIDTSALINDANLLQYFECNEYIRIPLKVDEELGSIKDKRVKRNSHLSRSYGTQDFSKDYDISTIARNLITKIDEFKTAFNKVNDLTFRISKANLDLLPEELNREIPDNMILAVALEYKDWDVSLITDDKQFKQLAEACNVNVLTGKEFIRSHEKYFCEYASYNKVLLNNKYSKAKKPSNDVKLWCLEHDEYTKS